MKKNDYENICRDILDNYPVTSTFIVAIGEDRKIHLFGAFDETIRDIPGEIEAEFMSFLKTQITRSLSAPPWITIH